MPQSFDVVVIGGGPGGYVAAIRAAQLGFNTACIDEWKRNGKASLGGTCLNVGCIPSKALLESSENYERVTHKFAAHGITAKGVEFSTLVMLERKNKIVDQLTAGIAYLFKKNKVTSLHGHGKIVKGGDVYQIEISDAGKTEIIESKHVVIATGSLPRSLPFAKVDNISILDNEGALAIAEVPKRLGVIGAGVIGLEMGSVWKRLGAEVTILEALPTFLGVVDEQVAKEALKTFTKEQGMAVHTGVKISAVAQEKKSLKINYTDASGAAQTLEVDKLIVAVGRVPHTSNLGLESIGVKTDARGFVEVDDHCKTSAPNVWAVGDVVRGPMLAHKGMEEGVAVAERIAGQKPHLDYNTIPWVIYTSPEIAWVGKTEQQLKAEGIEYRSGVSPFAANGRAKGLGETGGFVKMLADAKTDRILGVHIIGPFASEMITEAVVAMEFAGASEDIARIVHAHPSLSEVFHEAALQVDKRPIHN
ncbi:MAG: dihydrolipoyl dehydrogenase [Burkholderiales bacterium]